MKRKKIRLRRCSTCKSPMVPMENGACCPNCFKSRMQRKLTAGEKRNLRTWQLRQAFPEAVRTKTKAATPKAGLYRHIYRIAGDKETRYRRVRCRLDWGQTGDVIVFMRHILAVLRPVPKPEQE